MKKITTITAVALGALAAVCASADWCEPAVAPASLGRVKALFH